MKRFKQQQAQPALVLLSRPRMFIISPVRVHLSNIWDSAGKCWTYSSGVLMWDLSWQIQEALGHRLMTQRSMATICHLEHRWHRCHWLVASYRGNATKPASPLLIGASAWFFLMFNHIWDHDSQWRASFQRGDTTNQIFYTRTVFLDILLTVIGLCAQKDFAICAVLKELCLMHVEWCPWQL